MFLFGIVLFGQSAFGMKPGRAPEDYGTIKETCVYIVPVAGDDTSVPSDQEIFTEKNKNSRISDALQYGKRRVLCKKYIGDVLLLAQVVFFMGLCVLVVVVVADMAVEFPCNHESLKEKVGGYCGKLCEFFKDHPEYCSMNNGTTNSTLNM